jgi:hypothetical protein
MQGAAAGMELELQPTMCIQVKPLISQEAK